MGLSGIYRVDPGRAGAPVCTNVKVLSFLYPKGGERGTFSGIFLLLSQGRAEARDLDKKEALEAF